MAEAQDVKDPGAEEATAARPKRKNVLMLGILLGVMIAEGLVVFALMKNFAGATPTAAQAQGASGLDPAEGQKAPPAAEIKVAEFRAQNKQGQQAYIVQFTVFVTAAEPEKAKVEEAVTRCAAKLKDRISGIVRAMDPERFSEPDLTTLRAKLKEELTQVLGADVPIGEVLVNDFNAYPDS